MRKTQILLILIFLVTSCTNSKTFSKPLSKKQELATQIRKQVAYKLENERGLSPCGIGAQMMNQIEMLALDFNYYKPININEARELLIYATNQFANEVNETNEIHPYLANIPFNSKNIEISVYLRSPDGRDVGPNDLSIVSMIQGQLKYKINDRQTRQLKTVFTETYDEAVEKLKNGESKEPVVCSEPAPKISKEDWERLSKSMGFVSSDGSLWCPDENGKWVEDPICDGK